MTSAKGRRRTGSLYRRWKGKYYLIGDPAAKGKGSIYLRYKVGGKAIFKSLGTANAAEAKKKQAQIMRPLELASEKEVLDLTLMRLEQVQKEQKRELENGNPPLKLAEAWDAYLSSQNRPRSGQRTLRGYSCILRQFVKWTQKTCPSLTRMNEIGVEEAEAYAKHLLSRELSPSSYNQHLGALSLIWSVLADKARIKINPFAWDRKTRRGIQRLSIKAEVYQRRKRALSITEVNEVLEKAQGDYRTLILVLACTGQRLVDAVMLEWRQIDFDRQVITLVPKKTARRSGKTVYIPLLPALRKELADRNQTGRYVMPDLVKLYERDTAAVSKKIKEIFESAGIETAKKTDLDSDRVITDVGAHSLRHTFVTIARMAGFPDPVICQITGHSSQEMVDHYTQFSEEMIASLAGRLLSSPEVPVRALPEGTFVQPEPVPEWAREKIQEIASKITGKRNEKLKEELIGLLNR